MSVDEMDLDYEWALEQFKNDLLKFMIAKIEEIEEDDNE